jgi:23S rRNA-/tRNA-specific pseudouridylate synthase
MASAAPAITTTSLSAKEQEAVRLASSHSVPMDNPCWGGPDPHQHNLQHLLRQIFAGAFGGNMGPSSSDDADASIGGENKKNPLVLYEDENYVAITKPPDLRMDGPHPATVHKLLTYWYPPPSLLHVVHDADAAASSPPPSSSGSFNVTLADQISKLAKHSDLSDNALRPCHQLDFATSGVLLVARTRKAARVACRAFEERTTSKEYVAVVCGHVGGSISIDGKGDEGAAYALPVFPKSALSDWSDGTTEKAYRKKRNNAHKGTFEGFMPVHSIFGKWKAYVVKRMRLEAAASSDLANSDNELRRKRRRTTEGDVVAGDEDRSPSADVESVLLQSHPPLSADEERKLVAMRWKEVKKEGKYVQTFQDMAAAYNAALSKQKQQGNEIVPTGAVAIASKDCKFSNGTNDIATRERRALPSVFRVEGEDDNAFYIHAPLCEISGHFRVYLDKSSMPSSHPFRDYYTSTPVDKRKHSLDFKPSLTRCVVLWKGTYSGEPVSKVLLQPRTGRRHQLRLHLALLNNPILGDVTYVPTEDMRKARSNAALGGPDCHRMCLHAHKLSLPLLGGERKTFVAPDPFEICDGELIIAGEHDLAR